MTFNKNFKIANFEVSTTSKPLVIAEISANHNGKLVPAEIFQNKLDPSRFVLWLVGSNHYEGLEGAKYSWSSTDGILRDGDGDVVPSSGGVGVFESSSEMDDDSDEESEYDPLEAERSLAARFGYDSESGSSEEDDDEDESDDEV